MRISRSHMGTALLMENSGDMAQMLSIIDFWNRRWSPTEDFILQRVPNNIVQELNEAWMLTTKIETESENNAKI